MWGTGEKVGVLKYLVKDFVKKTVQVQHKDTQVCFSNCQDTVMGYHGMPTCLLVCTCHFLKLKVTIFHGNRIFSAVCKQF